MSAVRMNGGNASAVVASALESRLLVPAHVAVVRDRPVMPLNHSARLARVSMRGASLSRLYAREAFECTVAGQRWRWRWRYFEGPFIGLELRLRIGDTEVTMGIEDCSALGAADVIRPELPDALRAAYLTALGEPVWPVIEAALGRAVEITAVRTNCAMNITPECLSFEIGAAQKGTRGFLGPVDSNLQRLLCEVGERHGGCSPVSMNLPFEWAAVVGTTQLAASELHTIEIFDVVLIDDAVFNAEVLECQLVVGVDRHRAGRAALRLGELRMVQLTSPGAAFMTNPESQPQSTSARDSAFSDIPVLLRFELAQWQAPLSEVAQLASGAVIDLGHRIDGQSIAVWAGQRCIGRGQLVAIGERLGVRVLSLAGLERGDAPLASDRDASANAVPGG